MRKHSTDFSGMTAISELFVEEEVRDVMISKFKSLQNKEIIVECPDDWRDIWDRGEFPDTGTASVRLYDQAKEPEEMIKLGTVSWKTKFNIGDDGYGKIIEAEPVNIKFKPA